MFSVLTSFVDARCRRDTQRECMPTRSDRRFVFLATCLACDSRSSETPLMRVAGHTIDNTTHASSPPVEVVQQLSQRASPDLELDVRV